MISTSEIKISVVVEASTPVAVRVLHDGFHLGKPAAFIFSPPQQLICAPTMTFHDLGAGPSCSRDASTRAYGAVAAQALAAGPALAVPRGARRGPCAARGRAAGEGRRVTTHEATTYRAGDREGGGAHGARRLAAWGAPVDVNRATVEELASLDGVGLKLGARIVAARPFATIEDVGRVRGIGRRRLARCARGSSSTRGRSIA